MFLLTPRFSLSFSHDAELPVDDAFDGQPLGAADEAQ
jgi:hypothetical protein